MIERKKNYIMDALGALEDSFIAEAAEYVKAKPTWRYWREVGATAACVAAIAVTVGTMNYLPIGRSAETTGAASQENTSTYDEIKKEATMEGAKVESTTTMESVATAENTQEIVGAAENNGSTFDKALVYSQGIEYEIVTDKQWTLDSTSQKKAENTVNRTECWEYTEESGTITAEPDITESIQSQSCSMWLSAEEIFAQGNDIFMGIVTNMQVYHTTGKIDKYFTVATVEVKDSIRGEMEVGEECRIYLPLAEVNDMVSTNSLVGDLMELEVGSTAIFMPITATVDTGLGKQEVGEWLCYADFADYYFTEGMRYLFLATEDGVSYEEDVYEIPGEDITLVQVAEYIRGMLE